MINRDTLRYSLYVAIGAIILTLTGIFGSFEGREVIRGGLNLSTVLLIILLVGTGYLTATRAHKGSPVATILNGALGSLLVGAALSLLVLFQANVDLSFVFPNLKSLLGGTLTFGQSEVASAIVSLLVTSAALGAVGGLLPLLSARVRQIILISLLLTAVIGLLESQVNTIITLPDAVALTVGFGLAYIVTYRLSANSLLLRLVIGLVVGVIVGVVLTLLANNGGLAAGGFLRAGAGVPLILNLAANGAFLPLVVIFGIIGALGGIATLASRTVHDGALFFFVALLVLGVLNWQGAMTATAGLITIALLAVSNWFIPMLGKPVEERYELQPRARQRFVQRIGFVAMFAVLIVAPLFFSQYITDVLNLVGLYIIMGIGLNVVVGYAGLLDLGYVAFFAIGAYTVGLLTTPSMLTCGGTAPGQVTPENFASVCTGVMSFWEAWPVAVLISALAGVLLGIPVLRLRGDYLAIVTLGFGEIIRIIVKFDDFKPLFGAAQGVQNIPRPVLDLSAINPAWHFELTGATGIYYLALVGILITALVTTRLVNTRLGRAWRAMRADEDVAQAMGIELVRTKLLAFAIGAAFAGMGGAIAGTRLYGAYPDSYTLLVSINVLSLIIIGGLGSIPGVVVGSLVLIGLPEALRELQDYRLLAFGVLLVVAMLLKPEGLIPPPVRRLSEEVAERRAKEGARS
jgi:branched-chain amino acid transport system permease protein